MIRLAGREVLQDSTSKSDLHGWASRLDDQPGGQARRPKASACHTLPARELNADEWRSNRATVAVPVSRPPRPVGAPATRRPPA